MKDFDFSTFNYIANTWSPGCDTEVLEVFDKYTHKVIAKGSLADEKQIEETLQGLAHAGEALKKTSAQFRKEKLDLLYKLLEQKEQDFVELIIKEAGKPRSYAQAELKRSLQTLRFCSEELLNFGGEVVPIDYGVGVGKSAFTKRFPIGPVLCITPFNFPLNLLMHKVAPALALGCPIVVKAPPQTPLTAIALTRLIDQLDLPKGSFNLINCSNEHAQKLVEDNRVSLLSFTGSAKVGWQLKSLAKKKKVILELGGNAAALIDQSADLEKAAHSLAKGCYLYAGQICISTQRVFVHENVYDQFLKLFTDKITKIKAGDPQDPDVLVGPIIDSTHLKRLQDWVLEALESGAKELIPMQKISDDKNVLSPGLYTNTTTHMKIHQEEVFGPLAVIEKVSSFESGLEAINNSKYGLQAGVFTQQISHVHHAHQQLEVGAVIINEAPGFRVDSMPYGGVKDSGLGREGIKYALQDMSEPRLLVF